MSSSRDLEERYCAHNYHPLPVVLTRGDGVFVFDDAGKQYLDMMSAYSAVSHGHCNPRLVRVVIEQVQRLNIVSRAFHSDKLGAFLARACELTGMDMALPMNTGAEAVETAIKASRKWAYTVKGVPQDKAEIIGCDGNFHGRTLAAVAMSDEPQYRQGFGPFPSGFINVEFGNIDALKAAINDNTAAFIVEPIQGEGGIIMPPPGYLAAAAELCREHGVLLIADEIQTGLGRTGELLACRHENVRPDGLILGKALGGGILPVSLFLARRDVMNVFTPGDHGSTFGGNPLAAAVGLEALDALIDDKLVENSRVMGDYLIGRLRAIDSPLIREVRGKGLFIGLEIEPRLASARAVCEALMQRGLLSKETHATVVRLAPPLIIARAELDWAVDQITAVLSEMDKTRLAS
jgi:ornithine--oxo-acid transaminase